MSRSCLVRLGVALAMVTLWLWPTEASAGTIAADFDGDGVADVASLSSQAPRHITITSSAGHRVWLRLSGALRALVAADVDHDGHLDLIARIDSWRLRLWLNDGHGSFRESFRRAHRRRLSALPTLVTLRGVRTKDATGISTEGFAIAAPTAVVASTTDTAPAARSDAPLEVAARALERFGPRPPPSC